MKGLREKIKSENIKPYFSKEIPLDFIIEIIKGWNKLFKSKITTNRKHRRKLK